MDLNYVKKLVKLLSESDVDEIEIEEEGKKVRIVKRQPTFSAGQPMPVQYVQSPVSGTQVPAQAAAPAPRPESAPAVPTVAATTLYEIKSPIVGTFYRSPAPDAAPFVQIGAPIQSGMVLCIIEAMKLMNEIEADISGKIAKIMVENGQPVEYDQVLFLVEKE